MSYSVNTKSCAEPLSLEAEDSPGLVSSTEDTDPVVSTLSTSFAREVGGETEVCPLDAISSTTVVLSTTATPVRILPRRRVTVMTVTWSNSEDGVVVVACGR